MALFVQPFYKKKGLFATSAVDINHNPSSTTATASFHGTGRSVFFASCFVTTLQLSNVWIPRSKANIKSYQLSPRNVHKYKIIILEIKTKSADPTYTYLTWSLCFEYKWLQFVSLTNDVLDDEMVSWSAYHSSNGRGPHQHLIIAATISRTTSISSHNRQNKGVDIFLFARQTPHDAVGWLWHFLVILTYYMLILK